MRVSSSVSAAREAVSGFADMGVVGAGQQASVGSSTVAGMKRGVTFANSVASDVSELVSAVSAEVVALASEIEARDVDDAWVLGAGL